MQNIDKKKFIKNFKIATSISNLCNLLGFSSNQKFRKEATDRCLEYNLDIKELKIRYIESRTIHKTIEKICPICSKLFKTKENRKENRTTCSYSCSNTYFRSGKNNGQYKKGNKTNYRNTAFIFYEPKCNKCGYDKYKEVLVVHHKDRNRSNNNRENLEILCPTCHEENHFEAKDGKWTKNSKSES